MKLVYISDTHGDHERLQLPAGDVLIHAGDLTGHGTQTETEAFLQWFGAQAHTTKICVAGNHDTFIEQNPEQARQFAEQADVVMLNDSGITLKNVSFRGSPITPRFFDWSFMRDPGAPIQAHWNLIPDFVNVLITHGPPFGILNQVHRSSSVIEHTDCPSLLARVQCVKPSLHLFGHIHEGDEYVERDGVAYHNVSSMNEHYQMTHNAVTIDINDWSTGDLP